MGLKFIKGKWQAHLDKYLKLKLVEMVGIGWNPGLTLLRAGPSAVSKVRGGHIVPPLVF